MIKEKKSDYSRFVTSGFVLITAILTAALVFQLSTFLLGPSKSACTQEVCLAKYLEGPPAFNSPQLKSYLWKNHFTQSSGTPNYTLSTGFTPVLEDAMNYVTTHFKGKKGGSFAVMGAGDGEYQDLTLRLEKNFGWTGLLVEPHPQLFKMLKSKNRNAILSSNCVSPVMRPIKNPISHEKYKDDASSEEKFHKIRFSKIDQLNTKENTVKQYVQCVPLENLLFAADLDKKLDLLVLEMSGTDLDILSVVRMDKLPDTEIVIIKAHGEDLFPDIQNTLLDKNMVISKTFGKTNEEKVFTFFKFKDEFE